MLQMLFCFYRHINLSEEMFLAALCRGQAHPANATVRIKLLTHLPGIESKQLICNIFNLDGFSCTHS